MKNSKEHVEYDKEDGEEVAEQGDMKCSKCGGRHKTSSHGKGKSEKREKAIEKAKKGRSVPH